MVNDDYCFSIPMLPEDVAVDIFLRLPVESILRFKCVSKSWYASLTSPSFIAKHLSIQSKDHLFLPIWHKSEKHGTAYSVSNIDDLNTYAELDMLSSYMNHNGCRQWRIIGPCDGLIVITDFIGGDALICNIATRNFRTLPKSYFYPFPKNDFRNLICDPVHAVVGCVGIGYDCKIKDYKVLRILEIWDDSEREYQLPPKAEVFSIATDTCWREIDMTNFKDFVNFNDETYLDGTLYCMSWDVYVDETIISSFNFVEERFRNITLPPEISKNREVQMQLGVYKEELALFVSQLKFEGMYVMNDGDNSMDVWVMKETKTMQSWTKLLTIGPDPQLVVGTVFGFWKSDTYLIYSDHGGRLMVYDLVKMESKNIARKDDDYRLLNVTPFMKTLVSITGSE